MAAEARLLLSSGYSSAPRYGCEEHWGVAIADE